MSSPPTVSYRAQYARRIIRETLFQELMRRHDAFRTVGDPPGRGFLGGGKGSTEPESPHALPGEPAKYGPPKTETVLELGEMKFCIIGAGVAGMYLAMILDEMGVQYDLLEAADRVGGRLFTKRFSDEKNDYYDAGAMRYPKIPAMKRAFDLFKELDVPLIPFRPENEKCPAMYNDILGPPENKEDLDPYRFGFENGGAVPDGAVHDGPQFIFDQAFGPLKEQLADDFEAGFQVLAGLDKLTTREFLSHQLGNGEEEDGSSSGGLDFHTVQWMENSSNTPGLFDQSFSESIIDSLDLEHAMPDSWFSVDGGSSVVAEAMRARLKTQPTLNTTVQRIALSREEPGSTSMLVTFTTASGETETRKYDTVFNATPLACAHRMDLSAAELHPSQREALKNLTCGPAAAVGIKFKTPWWVTRCGIDAGGGGGVATTDLPLGTCVYPPQDTSAESPAVLLASYTTGLAAARIGSLVSSGADAALKELLLRDLARLHARGGITVEFLHEQ